MAFKHLSNRLLFWILSACLTLFLVFATLVHHQAAGLIKQLAQARAELAVANTVQKIEDLLHYVEHSVLTARSSLRAANTSPEQITGMLETLVADRAEVFGMALALEPDTLPSHGRFAPYIYRLNGHAVLTDLSEGDYDYLNKPWYRDAVDQGQPRWSEPYYDRGGGDVDMVTYSAPIEDAFGSGRILGVITADISLQSLGDIVSEIPAGFSGYAYILSAGGKFITHSRPELRKRQVESLPVWVQGNTAWRRVLEGMLGQQRGVERVPCDAPGGAKPCWVAYEPLANSPWSIAVVIPLAQIEEELTSLKQRMLTLVPAALGILAIVVLVLSRRLARPLNSLATVTERLARGELDTPVPDFNLQDETGRLARSIGNMQRDLKQHIALLTDATARRQRLESELHIAATIQARMLPDNGNSDVCQDGVRLVATMRAARQVGGDFYLYEYTRDGQLVFVLGDVSDKGIPAALFMARAIAEVKALLRTDRAPGALLAALNRSLTSDNDECMFVTAIAGLLDIRSGRCRLASAGHNPPLLIGTAASTLELHGGTALGLIENSHYDETTLVVENGQSLLLFTDGIDEAVNREQEPFGLERIIALVNTNTGDAAGLVDSLLRGVAGFQAGEQFDDITVLVVSR